MDLGGADIDDILVEVLPYEHVIDLAKALLMSFLVQDFHDSVSGVVDLVDCEVQLRDLELKLADVGLAALQYFAQLLHLAH